MALTNNQKLYIGCFAAIAVLCIATLAAVSGDFGGSDDSGGEKAAEYGYEAWTGDLLTIITGNPDYELPGETESLLFAVQAAIGAIIIGYFIGFNAANSKSKKSKDDEE